MKTGNTLLVLYTITVLIILNGDFSCSRYEIDHELQQAIKEANRRDSTAVDSSYHFTPITLPEIRPHPDAFGPDDFGKSTFSFEAADTANP